jgi:uncharacterized protein (DUF1684 family)
MTEPDETTASFLREWQRWEEARWNAVSARHGIASLADTTWLGPQEQRVDGAAGLWRADGDTAIGTGLAGSGYSTTSGSPIGDRIMLHPGESLQAGGTLLRIFARDGMLALRRLDPQAARRTSLRSISAYEPDPAWVVDARFTPRADPLAVEQFDGYQTEQPGVGALEFTLGGRAQMLIATRGTDELSVVFSDATSGRETYRFRFLRPPLPDEAGATTIDFTRAFLPPCSFSDHYVCPLPSPENQLDIAVTVGERLPVYADGAA